MLKLIHLNIICNFFQIIKEADVLLSFNDEKQINDFEIVKTELVNDEEPETKSDSSDEGE